MRYFLLFCFLLLASCNPQKKVDKLYEDRQLVLSDPASCGVDQSIYQLHERYFGTDENLTMRVRIVYFVNGEKNPLDRETLISRIHISNSFFLDANLDFQLEDILYVEGRPEDDSISLDAIQTVEKLTKEKRKDLREAYYIEHYQLWNTVFSQDGVLTAYIYDNVPSTFVGIAGGIGSTYFALTSESVSPTYHTWSHELGHCLGLYHTHESGDHTDGLNEFYGDRICDTYNSIDTLMNIVKSDCRYDNTTDIPNECIEILIKNIMSYTRKECRGEFTPNQNMRMRKIIEGSSDLRATIVGANELETINIVKLDYK